MQRYFLRKISNIRIVHLLVLKYVVTKNLDLKINIFYKLSLLLSQTITDFKAPFQNNKIRASTTKQF